METMDHIIRMLQGLAPFVWIPGLVLTSIAWSRYRRWSWAVFTLASLIMVLSSCFEMAYSPGCVLTPDNMPSPAIARLGYISALLSAVCPILILAGFVARWMEDKKDPNESVDRTR
jgi:hypothetical protein